MFNFCSIKLSVKFLRVLLLSSCDRPPSWPPSPAGWGPGMWRWFAQTPQMEEWRTLLKDPSVGPFQSKNSTNVHYTTPFLSFYLFIYYFTWGFESDLWWWLESSPPLACSGTWPLTLTKCFCVFPEPSVCVMTSQSQSTRFSVDISTGVCFVSCFSPVVLSSFQTDSRPPARWGPVSGIDGGCRCCCCP